LIRAAGEAAAHDLAELLIRVRTSKLSTAEINAADQVAVGPMTVGADRAENRTTFLDRSSGLVLSEEAMSSDDQDDASNGG
jgi:hypothetical protein